MVEITAMTYEQVRSKYFEEQMQKAQRRMKYWKARIDRKRPDNLMDEAHGKAADAGWEYNFYKDALEALAAQPKWISVKERLPEPNTTVLLIAHRWESQLVYIGELKKVESERSWLTGLVSKASEWTVYDFSYLKEPIVTHWMPLPEPPKEDA